VHDQRAFEGELAAKHPENHNIRAKIRQQLQVFRDLGFIEFLGSGEYRSLRGGDRQES
jgi:type II restriction enzyme